MTLKTTLLLIVFASVGVAPAFAQRTPATARREPATEAAVVAQGWALLAKRDFPAAAEKASEALGLAPRGLAALALAIEVHVARGGSGAALDAYERWLVRRTLEEPAAVRRIARAVLAESAASEPDSPAAYEARRALAQDGDAAARRELLDRVRAGGGADARALAASGDAAAVEILSTELKSPGSHLRTIEALGQSRQPSAVAALAATMDDPRSEIRGAVAEAMGMIGTPEAHGHLKSLVKDPSLHVRVKAASGLLRMNDSTGEPAFQELLAAADTPRSRLVAAEALAVRPDAAWLALVRGLLQAEEPDIRLAAARLIAAHDPEAAQEALAALETHQNPTVREEASRTAVAATSDLTVLRRALRGVDPLTRVAAAARILELTR